ncbi:LysR substrate-binding domain-containing protein [Pontibacillus sp. HN14]|nr:LysR substrate-binding domain-containing protein [Pontibacillus sp. HN14]
MNFSHLKVFYTAALKKNFSETAKSLHMSQPSVSLHVRQLEDSLETELFKRTTKQVYLTPAGELLFKSAESILNQVNDIKRDIQHLSGSVHGNLVIGASLTIGEHILPYMFGAFQQAYPQINITLKIYNSEQIIDKLNGGELHIGFIESMIAYPEFLQKAFQSDELIVISKPNYYSGSSLSTNELFSLPFISREVGSGTRQVIEESLRQNQLNPSKLQVVMELESTESIKSAVESGMGISIISKAAVEKELRLGTLEQLYLPELNLKRSLYAIYKKHHFTLAAEAFLEFVTHRPPEAKRSKNALN